jgi:endogenous inhibitor of DNA gyrase (YacG/DUF329 family)
MKMQRGHCEEGDVHRPMDAKCAGCGKPIEKKRNSIWEKSFCNQACWLKYIDDKYDERPTRQW